MKKSNHFIYRSTSLVFIQMPVRDLTLTTIIQLTDVVMSHFWLFEMANGMRYE